MALWTTPKFDEIKMDAEISSYQEDGDPLPFALSDEQERADG